jgi:hypothetical protein
VKQLRIATKTALLALWKTSCRRQPANVRLTPGGRAHAAELHAAIASSAASACLRLAARARGAARIFGIEIGTMVE